MPIAIKLNQGDSVDDIAQDIELLQPKLTRDMVVKICGLAIEQVLATQSPGIAYYVSLVLIMASRRFLDKPTEAIAAMSAGGVLMRNGHIEEARNYLQFACNVFEHEGDASLHAVALQRLGSSYLESDKPANGLPMLEQCLAISQQTGNIGLEAAAMNNIGTIYLMIGNTDKALLNYHNALSAARRANDERAERDCLGNLTNIFTQLNQWINAKTLILQAIDIDHKWTDKLGLVKDLTLLSRVEMALLGYRDAEDHLKQALKLAEGFENHKYEQICYQELMSLYEKTDNADKAIYCGRNAARIARERGRSEEEKAILVRLARRYPMS